MTLCKMVGNVVPKQRRENAVPPPPLASKAAAALRRPVESTKKKEGAGLADLRDVDKAKVARLINHVMMAFREIERLKEVLELERSKQEALVSKLQQQNHEVTAELRLRLASLQLVSPLPSQKAFLNTGRRPSLSPIREAECSEAESDITRSQEAPERKNEEAASILRERENLIGDFTTTTAAAGGKDNGVVNKFEATEQFDESAQTEECQTSYSQAGAVSESQGKENKDPECPPPQCKGETQTTTEEDSGVLRKRPPPRPLPDLLTNILQRCKDVGCVPSAADRSEPSFSYVAKRDAVPILGGNSKPTAPKPPPQLAQASKPPPQLAQASKPRPQLAQASKPPPQLAQASKPPPQLAQASKPPPQLAQASNSSQGLHEVRSFCGVDLDGHGSTTRPEAGGRDALGCKHLDAGRRQETFNGVALPYCTCAAFHECLPNCLERQSAERLAGPEKAGNETCNPEDVIEPKTCANHKKLRFDPSAGEEGIFYYASDVEKTATGSLDIGSLQSPAPGERTEVQVGGKTEPPEGHRQDGDALESHWTPQAIERRNSFHKIPVVSPRSNDGSSEGHGGEERSFFSNAIRAKIPEKKVSNTREQEQLPTSESDFFSIRNEKSKPQKPRRPSHRPSKCINCSSYVPRRSKTALLSAKHFPKLPRRCPKCSSIVEPKASAHRSGEIKRCRERIIMAKRRNKHSSTGESRRQNAAESSTIETSECVADECLNASDPSTPSSSENGARCGDCTSRLKSRSLRSLPRKPTRGGQGARKRCAPAVDEEEGSDPSSSVVFSVASEDIYMSTQSSPTDRSKARRRHLPILPSRVCRIHTRKIKKKRGRVREMKSVRLFRDQSSERTEEAFRANREMLEMLLQSDGKYRGPRKAPRAADDSAECRIETWRFKKPHRSPRKESTTEEGVEQTARAIRDDHHRQRRKPGSEKWSNFEVDELLDRFVQSNAECAAELVKCSVYFESTSRSSRPSSSSRGTLLSDNAAEQGMESGVVSAHRAKPRRELFTVDHNGLAPAQFRSEESVQCSKCGVRIKPERDLSLLGSAIEMIETKEHRDLCDTCSASVTPEKTNRARRSDETRPAAPIVLPRVSSDDPLKIHNKAVRPRKSGMIAPTSSTVQNCSVKRSGDWASEALQDRPDLRSEDHRMPIITGVSVSSRRSTPPRETEDGETAKELTEMFDMSLFDLVNDLEGQRRDYWRRINNSHGVGVDDGTGNGKQCDGGRRVVDVGEVRRPSVSRRPLPGKQIHANHFR